MKLLSITSALIFFTISATNAQQAKTINDSIMITVFLKHQQDKNLKQIEAVKNKNKFDHNFPPSCAKIVSWYVMMGIGQVVTLKLPAAQLRTLNIAVENSAWEAFSTEFYPTYDFEPIRRETIKNNP